MQTKLFILFLLLVFRFQISFLEYLNFKYFPVKEIEARVFAQYKKKNYYVLKLKNDEVTFYTTSRENLKNLLNEKVKLKIFTKDITFWGYLTKFYAPSFDLKLEPVSKVEKYIESQHSSIVLSNLFKALFLGESMEYSTRIKLSTLGVSHLFALSGLHLGFISFLLYFLLSPIYNLFHKKFPYRNKFVDLGIIVLLIEFLYLKITSFPPSLIRAFVMEVVLFFFFVTLRNVFSIKVLVLTFLVSFYIFSMKIINIGFLLSIVGVYYIYLFFSYFKATFKSGLVLSFYMFIVMFVWGHYFFGEMNIYQLFSPIVNLLFSIFYPIEAILHIFGVGGLFDSMIEKYLSFGEKFYYVNISFWFLFVFAFFSIIAFKKKIAFYGINILGIILILGSIRF
ncbi:ComEC/Rec2 family competence protein [Caminibacter profundus]